MPDNIKSVRLQQAQQHLDRAHKERAFQCKAEATSNPQQSDNACSPTTIYYSYDYAQQVYFPYSPQQSGPEYFRTTRKCWCLLWTTLLQVNYLIGEAQDVGKGADVTLSLLHHFLSTHSLNEQVQLHADNCVGQNKNNANIHYLMWRVMTGKHKEAHLSFMLIGHTNLLQIVLLTFQAMLHSQQHINPLWYWACCHS